LIPKKAPPKELMTTEKAAFEMYKEMQELAFARGGMAGVLQVGAEAHRAAAAQGTSGAPVAGLDNLLKFIPGILKSLRA
jgi:hypothetical protein